MDTIIRTVNDSPDYCIENQLKHKRTNLALQFANLEFFVNEKHCS